MSSIEDTCKDDLVFEFIGESNFASKKERFLGFLITKLAFVLFTILFIAFSNMESTLAITACITISLLVHLLLLLFRHQTLGMMVMKIKIAPDGVAKFSIIKVLFWRLILSMGLPFFILSIGLPLLNLFIAMLLLLNYLNIIANKTNRCIHDELSNSVVIKISAL